MARSRWSADRARPNAHPRLPDGFSYWQMQTDMLLPDGTAADLFVPLDLSTPELAPTYDAVLTLEEDLRGDYRDSFNQLALEDRRALCEDTWSAARGEHVERDIPRWFWKLDIDRASWLASARPSRQ